MGIITINGKKVEFTNEKNLLTIIRNAGIEVPTLCYPPELSLSGPAACVLWKTTGAAALPPALRSHGTVWSFTPTPKSCASTAS